MYLIHLPDETNLHENESYPSIDLIYSIKCLLPIINCLFRKGYRPNQLIADATAGYRTNVPLKDVTSS